MGKAMAENRSVGAGDRVRVGTDHKGVAGEDAGGDDGSHVTACVPTQNRSSE